MMQQYNERTNQNIIKKIEKCRDSKGKGLDLGNLGLNGNEPALKLLNECHHLEILNFANMFYQIDRTLVRSRNSGPKNELRTIPFLLPPSLQRLSLSENQLSKIEGIEGLTHLQYLDLTKNQISKIEGIEGLAHLHYLYLSNNQISKIEGIEGLTQLHYLYLSNNQISKIEGIEGLTHLHYLYLSNNQISKVEGIEGLTQLQTLDLTGNQISKIEGIEGLTQLQTLDLTRNQISKIEGIERLTQLQTLDLSENQISKIECVEELTQLKSLYLFNNQISKIECLEGLTQLQTLDLTENQISKIEGLEGLTQLLFLYLSGNQIGKIECLEGLTQLQSLYLSGNQIGKIEGIEGLRQSVEIRLDGNPIINCPSDIWQTNDAKQIRAYFEKEKEKKISSVETKKPKTNFVKQEFIDNPQPTKDVKLILLGNSNVGKTNLVYYLQTGKFLETRNTTHGLDVIRWKPDIKRFPKLNNIEVSIWDFGGQEYYHEAYKLFLSVNAVYLVMWCKESDVNKKIDTCLKDKDVTVPLEHFERSYWLDTVRYYGKKDEAQLLLIQNKVDNQQTEKERIDQKLHNDYGIKETFHLSLKEGCNSNNEQQKRILENFEIELELLLCETADKTPPPTNWLIVRDAIIKYSDEGNIFKQGIKEGSYLSLKDFNSACQKLTDNQLSEEELYTLPRWLNKGGVVVYFEKNEQLMDKVFVSPKILSEKIYEVLNKSILDKHGVFKKEDINFGEEFKETFIAVTKDLGLVFEHPLQEDQFIAPQYLPAEHAIEDLFKIASANAWQDSFWIKVPLFFYKKLLNYLVLHFVQDKNTTARYFWKHGIVFIKNNLRILIKGLYPSEHETEGIILMGVENGSGKKEMQKEIFNIIYSFNDNDNSDNKVEKKDSKRRVKIKNFNEERDTSLSYVGADINENESRKLAGINFNPINKYLEISCDGKNFIPYATLNDSTNETMLVPGTKDKIYISSFEPALVRQLSILKPKRIFVSYSHQNTAWLNKLKIHLAGLRRSNIIENWTDQEILAGEKWDKKIKENMEAADVFVCLLSADFVASEYIWNTELKSIFESLKKKSAQVVFIYVEPFDIVSIDGAKTNIDLTDTSILDFEIIPKDENGHLKAASEWSNENKAMAKIAESIRKAVDQK